MGKIKVRKGQEGSRWWNQRPSSEEVAKWFEGVPLHEEMDHNRYINGIVLIEQSTKTNEIEGEHQDGAPKIREDVHNLTYTPYPKVETRVQYFHDLMAKHEEDWMGVIEPVGGGENGLPPGFFIRTISTEKGDFKFLCCTIQVKVFLRSTVKEQILQTGHRGEPKILRSGQTVIEGAPGTKIVRMATRYQYPDENSVMKAETGAVGRALGMAGMLIIPGAGVATAEDMHEAKDHEENPIPAEKKKQAKLPESKSAGDKKTSDLSEEATSIVSKLKKDFPEVFTDFKAWCEDRDINSLAEVTEPSVLRGLIKKAKKQLAAAEKGKAESEEAPGVEETDADPEPEPEKPEE